MIGVLPRIMPCFRIHVSGDLHSASYIDAWRRICASLPRTRFWTYTRSWKFPELIPALECLLGLDNVQVFGSVDPTTGMPPKGWRVAFINTDGRADGLLCPEQTGQTAVFGAAETESTTAQPQNIFEFVLNSAWTSRPITGSYCVTISPYSIKS